MVILVTTKDQMAKSQDLVDAGVVELVDTQDLKSCEGNLVRVQVPPLVHAVNQWFSLSILRGFFIGGNLGYNIGTTNSRNSKTRKFRPIFVKFGFSIERFRFRDKADVDTFNFSHYLIGCAVSL